MSSSEPDPDLLLWSMSEDHDFPEAVRSMLPMLNPNDSKDWQEFVSPLVNPMEDYQLHGTEHQSPPPASPDAQEGAELAPTAAPTEQPPARAAPGAVPALESWPGTYNFGVTVKTPPSAAAGRQLPYVYSEAAAKLYTDVMVAVPVAFRTAAGVEPRALAIRATPVYREPHHAQTPVRRCAIHRDAEHAFNTGEANLLHVLWSEHPQASYEENQERRSVTVPLERPAPGTADYQVLFKFTCMNTCVGGINRRRLMVVFTLEEIDSGVALGRQAIEVKVCRCPHRDWRADEKRRGQQLKVPVKRRREPSPGPGGQRGRWMVEARSEAMYNYLVAVRDNLEQYDRDRAPAAGHDPVGDGTPVTLRRQPTMPVRADLE
ncbi:cellular tumor antigen p53-like isoform X2 [Pollicipes pollicipes]|nr:cellular tumor antigen p53-like isoform X2 [Pollicipes pollicipes]XP_037074346.1 cellular tumor antigen p53-like isoform X2 [Pollicipes pollicipes]XP_037074347.1 cellular tumor antigen p53-like isoform X2 [Pollicipes pollicipes]XP_037074348.1 cellular tumor antigen p53-like isoform X2 [Pollicipes pollicipes]